MAASDVLDLDPVASDEGLASIVTGFDGNVLCNDGEHSLAPAGVNALVGLVMMGLYPPAGYYGVAPPVLVPPPV